MKKYLVVEIKNDGYQNQMVSDDGTKSYVWGAYAGRKGLQDILNFYAKQGWELFQLTHLSDLVHKDYRAIFVRNV